MVLGDSNLRMQLKALTGHLCGIADNAIRFR
jgi:hypothetical protein